MDFKSFLIGFLACLCIMLLTGFGGSSSVGRYQFHDGADSIRVIDTTTGMVRLQRGVYEEFKITDKSRIR